MSSFFPKTFIFGIDSFIGNTFYKFQKTKTQGTSRRAHQNEFIYYDLKRSLFSDLNVDWSSYDYALICFGKTKLSFCENHKEESFALNVSHLLSLVKELYQRGVKPIVFSSDLVFDGTQEEYDDRAKPHPLNEYGRQKYVLEQEVKTICQNEALILRMSKVYECLESQPSFLFDIINQFQTQDEVRAAVDYYFCPMALCDVLEAIMQLQVQNETGLFNLAGEELISWFELCELIAKTFHFPLSKIKPILLSEINPHIKRPAKIHLLPKRLKKTLPDFKFTGLLNQLHQIKKLNPITTPL